MKKALIIIDMLNDFVEDEAPLKVPGVKKIVGPIKKEIDRARQDNYPVIYLCDCHEENDREFKLFPPHAVKGTRGASIVDELRPEGTDLLVRKSSFSGFFNTDLEEILNKFSVKKIIVTGTATNICVLYTVADAVMRGYKVDIVKDAVIGLNKKDHKFALKQMQDILKANII
jgi:nicotinamidase/pyrazinamidase